MKKITYWLPVILLIVLVFHFSAQPSTQQDIRPYIKKYHEFIKILQDMPAIEFYYHQRLVNSHQDTVGFIQFMLRKMIHLSFYGILGLSLLQAITATRLTRFWRLCRQPFKPCLPGKQNQPSLAANQTLSKHYQQRPKCFTWNIWLLAALIVVTIAILDEYQQSMIPSRTGCWEDVLLDFCGFLLMTFLLYIWHGLRDLFY